MRARRARAAADYVTRHAAGDTAGASTLPGDCHRSARRPMRQPLDAADPLPALNHARTSAAKHNSWNWAECLHLRMAPLSLAQRTHLTGVINASGLHPPE